MDKFDYVKLIVNTLRGSTGNNFQQQIGVVLKEYYKNKHVTYEMPSYLGGDKKMMAGLLKMHYFIKYMHRQEIMIP